MTTGPSHMRCAECVQATPRRLHLWEPASFLFDEIILNAANALRSLEDSLPIRLSLPEQNLVALIGIRRPVFTMDGPNASRVGSDPGHRIGSPLDACAHIELQHHGRLRVL